MAEQKRVSRKWLYVAWGTSAMLLALYYGLWRYAANEIETGIETWAETQRAQGINVEFSAIERAGFPFFMRIRIKSPVISDQSGQSWRAEAVSLHALPYNLNKVVAAPQGEQWLRDRAGAEWTMKADDWRASLARDKARGWAFAMNIVNARATRSDGAAMRLGSLIMDLAPEAEDPTTLTLALASTDGAFIRTDSEIAIASVNTAASLTHIDALIGVDPLAFWRSAGGVLRIHGLNAVINEAEFSLFGDIRVDSDDYPVGALNAELLKPLGLAEPLAASGVMSEKEAQGAAAALSFAAMAQGGKVKAPIKLHAGEANIAGVKIADLPRLRAAN